MRRQLLYAAQSAALDGIGHEIGDQHGIAALHSLGNFERVDQILSGVVPLPGGGVYPSARRLQSHCLAIGSPALIQIEQRQLEFRRPDRRLDEVQRGLVLFHPTDVVGVGGVLHVRSHLIADDQLSGTSEVEEPVAFVRNVDARVSQVSWCTGHQRGIDTVRARGRHLATRGSRSSNEQGNHPDHSPYDPQPAHASQATGEGGVVYRITRMVVPGAAPSVESVSSVDSVF